MPQVLFAGAGYEVAPNETVLDCLLRNGHRIPHSCKAGACQSCLMKSDTTIPSTDIKDTLAAQGYFLACAHRPTEDISVTLPATDQRHPARISKLEPLNQTVMRVRLRPEQPLDYFPGQYVTLFREDRVARSYSIASLPHEDEIELHVRKVPGGAMSEWLHTPATLGSMVTLQGPAGNCFYTAGSCHQPLILAGAGTGLAPLYGILRDALAQHHQGPIWLFHGALTTAGLYLTDDLLTLQSRHPNFRYIRSVLRETESSAGAEIGELHNTILTRFPNLAGHKGYICGDPALVNSLRKKFFLAGMASKSIYADAFLPSSP
jgi:CDP-4-dehydro-6-deoxyglucose reductase